MRTPRVSYAVRRMTPVHHPDANVPRLVAAGNSLTGARIVRDALRVLHPEYRFAVEETTVKIID